MADVTDQGVQSAIATGDPKFNAEEAADVTRWLKRIEDARKFDEDARKQMAMDRRYARGDAGSVEDCRVSIPIASSYIDILCALLSSKQPDLDVQPADGTQPPPMQDILELAREQIGKDPATHAMMIEVGTKATIEAQQHKDLAMQQAAQEGMDPQITASVQMAAAQPQNDPAEIGEQAAQAWLNAKIQEEAKEMMKPYQQRLSQSKQFGSTIRIIVETLWKRANLKGAAKQQTRSCLSIAGGWFKATWQQRVGQDPVVLKAIQDAQTQLALLEGAQTTLADGTAKNDDALRAEIQQRITGLQAKVEVVLARGLAVDFVRGEDVQWAQGVSMENYLDAPWGSHRAFKTKEEAVAEYPQLKDKIKGATLYYQEKPADPMKSRDVGEAAGPISADEADQFRTSSSVGSSNQGDGYVCLWEIQDKSTGNVLGVIEGIRDTYAIKPYPPKPSARRFYSLFQLAMLWVDGERHPQSLVKRSARLFDEINRLYSNASIHRSRAIPKIGVDATNMAPEEVKKYTEGGIGEVIPIKPTIPGSNIAASFVTLQYNKFDESLYDVASIMRMLEIVWAVQEALASSINVEKTATEAEIQQSGTNARTAFKRSAIDDVMDELAMYTTELALQMLSHEDAVAIAGPWAYWPEETTVQDLDTLVQVQIKAGSTGKPNTSQQQQVWATIFPLIRDAIVQIGQLRGSSPEDIANGLEEVISETFNRTGENLDPSRFIPQVPSNEPGAMPTKPQAQGAQPPPASNGAAPGPVPPAAPPPNQLPVPNHAHVAPPAP